MEHALEVDPANIIFSNAATWYQVYTFVRECYKLAGFERYEHYIKDFDHETEFFTLYQSANAYEIKAKFLSFMGAGMDVWDDYDCLLQKVYSEKMPSINHDDIMVLDQYRENMPKTMKLLTLCIATTMLQNPTFRKVYFHDKKDSVRQISADTLGAIMNFYFLGEAEALQAWDSQLEAASFQHVQQQYKNVGVHQLWAKYNV